MYTVEKHSVVYVKIKNGVENLHIKFKPRIPLKVFYTTKDNFASLTECGEFNHEDQIFKEWGTPINEKLDSYLGETYIIIVNEHDRDVDFTLELTDTTQRNQKNQSGFLFAPHGFGGWVVG